MSLRYQVRLAKPAVVSMPRTTAVAVSMLRMTVGVVRFAWVAGVGLKMMEALKAGELEVAGQSSVERIVGKLEKQIARTRLPAIVRQWVVVVLFSDAKSSLACLGPPSCDPQSSPDPTGIGLASAFFHSVHCLPNRWHCRTLSCVPRAGELGWSGRRRMQHGFGLRPVAPRWLWLCPREQGRVRGWE